MFNKVTTNFDIIFLVKNGGENMSLQKTITRTIKIDDSNLPLKRLEIVQDVKFQKISGAWHGQNCFWEEYHAPKIKGMKPDISIIPRKNVGPHDKSETIVIHYSPIDENQNENVEEKQNDDNENVTDEVDDPSTTNQEIEPPLPPDLSNLDVINHHTENAQAENNAIDNSTINDDADNQIHHLNNDQNIVKSQLSPDEKFMQEIDQIINQNSDNEMSNEFQNKSISPALNSFLKSLKIGETGIEWPDEPLDVPFSRQNAWLADISEVTQTTENIQEIGKSELSENGFKTRFYI